MARGRKHDAKGRSKGDGQFVPIPYSMAHHEAWRSLLGAAVKVWLELRCRYNGANNGQLHLSLDEAATLLRLGKETVRRAFAELETKGFVKKRKKGHFHGRMAAEWEVTDQPHNGYPATRDWQCVDPKVYQREENRRFRNEPKWLLMDPSEN